MRKLPGGKELERMASRVALMGSLGAWLSVFHASTNAQEVNLALVATPTTSFVSGHETITALNDGFTPANSDDKSHGAYGNWPRSGTQWVQYDWTQPISTKKIEVYWFDDHRGVRLPKACRLLYWDGTAFLPVKGAGLGLEENRFNTTTFEEVTTSRLRLELDSNGTFSTGILDWRVYDSGKSPNFAPVVHAGTEAVIALPGKVYLSGTVKDDGKKRAPVLKWTKASGPGSVSFEDATSATTTAWFSKVGDYVLQLAANDGELSTSDTVAVKVEPAPPCTHLEPVWTTNYTVSSPFWAPRLKNTIMNWIPHCVQKINDPKLPEGGIENFVQAANKLGGREAKHVGAPFANAWVYNTFESMCLATLVEAQRDPELLRAQSDFRKTIDDWLPKILGAQEPDGYLQTMYTIRGLKRWSNRADHEDYNAGYFIDAAIAHYQATGGKDRRMLEAAIRLANCWCENFGPSPKRYWFGGHQELEQSLVRFARFLKTIAPRPPSATPDRYIELAKFLLDCRRDGDEYDQSHLPVTHQYEAVGHAVRAVYGYSGMTDIAIETGDIDYHSAVKSIWHSIVNRKYYVTGGIGSGETSEGFGKNFSLPNNAYCESCAGCGELFFQHKMQLAYHQARYADLFEETLYNAVLGGLDLQAQNFTYTNPLDSDRKRYKWHACPCCVGNIPRTLLSLPTWMYSKSADAVYVNLFAGSTVDVGIISGTTVRLTQRTDYPWNGQVSLVLNPAKPARFTLHLRAPNRNTSELYKAAPECEGITSLAVNGKTMTRSAQNGYVSLTRKWTAGDRIEFEVPLQVQRITPDHRISAARGRVALRYGPLLYNIESLDQNLESALAPDAPLTAEWDSTLLGGMMVIKGKFANGTELKAVPNYARLNRGGRSIVWIRTP